MTEKDGFTHVSFLRHTGRDFLKGGTLNQEDGVLGRMSEKQADKLNLVVFCLHGTSLFR